MPKTEVDDVDRAILRVLLADGRCPLTEVAQRVNLSPAPVKRRIDRLERIGMITGYTALVDQSLLGGGFEAFVEVRFAGNTNVRTITAAAAAVPEVSEIFTVAGDPDALVHISVNSVQHLQEVVDNLRKNQQIIGTKTLIVLGSWRRSGHETRTKHQVPLPD